MRCEVHIKKKTAFKDAIIVILQDFTYIGIQKKDCAQNVKRISFQTGLMAVFSVEDLENMDGAASHARLGLKYG
jgi:hypothetical protein